jgi:hypothetical protein
MRCPAGRVCSRASNCDYSVLFCRFVKLTLDAFGASFHPSVAPIRLEPCRDHLGRTTCLKGHILGETGYNAPVASFLGAPTFCGREFSHFLQGFHLVRMAILFSRWLAVTKFKGLNTIAYVRNRRYFLSYTIPYDFT